MRRSDRGGGLTEAPDWIGAVCFYESVRFLPLMVPFLLWDGIDGHRVWSLSFIILRGGGRGSTLFCVVRMFLLGVRIHLTGLIVWTSVVDMSILNFWLSLTERQICSKNPDDWRDFLCFMKKMKLDNVTWYCMFFLPRWKVEQVTGL